METAKKVAEILLSIKAVTLSLKKPYRYASGILSPIYCDNRLLMSYPKERIQIRDFYVQTMKEHALTYDIVGGTATAGIPHAAWVADALKKPMIYVRAQPKDHGKENLVEGKLEGGQTVLVIEDLVSTGGSSVGAVKGIRDQGGIVNHCIAIFTYEMEKAKKQFADGNCTLFALSNFSTLIGVAQEMNHITPEEKRIALEWNKDPSGWGKKMGFE